MLTRSVHIAHGVRIQKTVFVSSSGSSETKEIHLLLSGDSSTKVSALLAACREQALKEQTPIIFQRFFVSDAKRQQADILSAVEKDKEQEGEQRAVSIIQQPPTDGSSLALWAYLSNQKDYTQLWTTNLTAQGADSQEQTEKSFLKYISALAHRSLSLEANCQRTWLFVDDIDNRYAGMVLGRNNIFDSQGLTLDNHFIASTGIAGSSGVEGAYVMMDAVAYDLPREKVHYLYAADHLNRTSEYGVRFERGVVLALPHSTQVFISGTASIDNRGEIVFPDDVVRQAERMMSNVEALLAEAQCKVSDIQQALVYLRHASDGPLIAQWFEEHYPLLPHLILYAPVCRPKWLVELECMAMR